MSEATCLPCDPPERADVCLEGGRCAVGHVSLEEGFCLDCVESWYNEDDRCGECPSDTTAMMVVAGTAFMAFAMVMLKLGAAGKARPVKIEEVGELASFGGNTSAAKKLRAEALRRQQVERNNKGAGASVTIPFSLLFTELQITMRFYELNLQWPASTRAFSHSP